MSASGPALTEIQKRDGRIVAFDRTKIVAAIMKAAQAVQGSDYRLAEGLADHVVARVDQRAAGEAMPTVEAIQDTIETVLIEQGHARTAKAFILYRARRSRIRDGKSELMDAVGEILQRHPGPAAKHAAIGAAASREFYLNRVLGEEAVDGHLDGAWHLHGLAHYDQTPHAAVLPYGALLREGFAVGHATVRPPRRAASAAALTATLLQAAATEVHGGLAVPRFDADFAAALPADTTDAMLDDAMEALVYGLNLPSPATGLAPRATLHVGLDASDLGRRVTAALLRAMARGLGHGEPAIRPHVAFMIRDGVNRRAGEPNADLTRAAAALPGVSFVHDAADAAIVGHAVRVAGPAATGVLARLSLNLPRLALQARREGSDLAVLLDAAIDAAAASLRHRAEALEGRAAALPFGMQADALALNLVGLGEALLVHAGRHHGGSAEARAAGAALIERAAARCARISAEGGRPVLLQAMDAPGAAERFAKLDRRAFGIVRGVTDRAGGYTAGVGVPDAELGDVAASGGYAALLPGGCLGVARAGTIDPDAVLAWLDAGFAAGHRLLAFEAPVAGLTRYDGFLEPSR